VTIAGGAIAELAIAGDATAIGGGPPGGGGVGAAAVWAYELLPGITAGEMLTTLYEALAEVEPGYDAGRVLRIIAASVAGKTSGGPSGFIARNISDTQNQISGVADASGNRSSATYGP
jgi:hypothetical protein